LERISDIHLDAVRKYLRKQLETIGELRDLVAQRYSWLPFPEPVKGSVYAVDGSRMMKRLSGAIIYAVSAAGIGENMYHWHEIGLVSPYKHVDERVRIHMEILEKRMGAMLGEMGADLILIDGTLSGSIIRPPTYIGSNTDKLYDKHKDNLYALSNGFLKLLDRKWDEWKERLESEGIINFPTLLSRGEGGKNIFEVLAEEGVSEARGDWWKEDEEDIVIFLEYLELLHALDRLFAHNVASIAKTFYRDDIVRSVSKERIIPMLDAPVLDALSPDRGYVPFQPQKEGEKTPTLIIDDLMDAGHFRNLLKVVDRKINGGKKTYSEKINPFYIRFVEGGVVYLLEIPGHQDPVRTIALILSVSEDEYVVPLEYAHHAVVIKKPEFEAYVNAILSALVSEDERFLSFLRYGREPLE